MQQRSDGAREAFEDLAAVVDRIPFLGGLKRDLSALRRVVYERRAPRIVAVGAPGAGKSSLLNALLGKPALPVGPGEPSVARDGWVRVDAEGARIDWLEARPGLEPAALRAAFDESLPDLILLVAPPERIEEGLGPTLEVALDALSVLTDEEPRPPVLAVLSRVDDLGRGAEAEARLGLIRQTLDRRLEEAGLAVEGLHVVAVPAQRGIAELSEAAAALLPERGQVEGARALSHADRARREVARGVVRSCSTLAITVAVMPVPLSDLTILLPLQVLMVTTLAYLAGRSWDRRTAAEWIGSLGVVGGAGLGFRWTAQQLAKLVPGAGSIVSAGVAGAGTAALGRSAVAYFLGDRSEEGEAAAL